MKQNDFLYVNIGALRQIIVLFLNFRFQSALQIKGKRRGQNVKKRT